MKNDTLPLLLVLFLTCISVQCKRKKDVFVDDTMTTPLIIPSTELVPLNTKVVIQSNHPTAQLEYSIDEGKNWQAFQDSLTLTRSLSVSARNKIDKNVSESRKIAYTLTYKRVLIIGNSITRHDPAPQLGWTGDWGMAASAVDKDYVTYIKRELLKRNINTEFSTTNKGSVFEISYFNNFNFSTFDDERNFNPDLVIIRLGDNVEDRKVKDLQFEDRFGELVKYLTKNNKQVKVVCTGSFWDRWETSLAIEKVAKQNGYGYIELGSLNTRSNTAYGKFTNNAVASHPSDRGMEEIAKRIISLL